MSLKDGNSLYWKAGIDTSELVHDATATKGIIANLAKQISATDIFVSIGTAASLYLKNNILEVTKLSARYDTLGVVMRTVGNNAGYSNSELSAYQNTLEKTGISMISSRQAIIKLIQAQLDLKQSSELARVAQDAAVIGNINSSEAYERMVNGIQSAQVEILRTIGINVNFENSYQKVAKATGRTTTSFNEAEKAQIRMNAVLEAGTEIAGSYEAAMGTAGKQLLSMERYVENLKVLLGQAFTPALAEIVDELTISIKGTTDTLEENNNKVSDWGNKFRLVLITVESEIIRLSMLIDKIGGTLTATIGLIATSLQTAFPYIGAFKKLSESMSGLNVGFENRYNTNISALQSLADKYVKIQDSMTVGGKNQTKTAEDELEKRRLLASQNKIKKEEKAISEEEKKRREKLYEELLDITMTEEEKIAAVKKHYSDLRSVADTDARKKAIDTLEAKDLEYLKFQKDLGQEELQYKMSWSEEELNNRIADLNTLMAQYEGNAQAEYEAYQELQTRKAQLDDIYKEKRENTLKSLFKSTKYMTEQEIKDYKKILELELTKINDNETVLSISQEIARTEEEIQNRQIEKLQDVSKIFTGIASNVREYNSDLADALQIISDMSDTLISMKEAISAESFLTSVTSLLSVGTTLGNVIFKGLTSGQHNRNSDLYKEDTSDFGYFQETIEFQKDFYERLTNELDRASGTDKLAQYKTNMSVLLSNIKNSQNSLKQLEGEQLDNMKDYITDLQDELATLQDEYKQAITGTTVESIADSISEGFQEGLSSAEMFADSFENMMKTAILTSFKNQIVTDYISSFYDTFANFSENGLSEAEIDALSGTFRQMMTESADLWTQMEEIASNAGIDLSSTSTDTGLSGAFSGITEETAGLLAGQFNAVRINTIQIKASVDNLLSPVMDISNLNRSMLSALNNIDDNTAKTAKYTQVLNSIDSRLAAMQNAGAYIRAIG